MIRSTIIIFSACLALAGCSYMDTENDVPGLRISLNENDGPHYVAFDSNDQPIIMSFESISDYRCPEGACCFSMGGYSVNLLIRQHVRAVQVALCNGECEGGMKEKDMKTFVLNGRVYSISLIELTPLPTLQNQDVQKTVVLELK